jgi:hypothetical protein
MLLINIPGIIAVTVLASLTLATTCYDYSGNPQTSSFFNTSACDPSAATSSCCDWADFCLSNGLCFDAGSNNLLAVQGCTDPSWDSPCHNYCKGSSLNALTAIPGLTLHRKFFVGFWKQFIPMSRG